MNSVFVLALLSTALVMPFVAAEPIGDCDSKGAPALGIVTIGTGPAIVYIDDRNLLLGNGLWVYVESNTMAGLQRGGSSIIVPDDNEICVDSEGAEVGPDLLIL